MAGNLELKKFVDTYGKYYFYELSLDEKKDGKNQLGVTILHPTSKKTEDMIMGKLSSGKQSIETIAWKMGVDDRKGNLKTRYHEYPRDVIKEFCRITNKKNYCFDGEDKIREIYDDILSVVCNLGLNGYGSVYIISSMFFLSNGAIPIYDYYAHVAVKALLYGVNPQEIYVPQAPSRDEHSRKDKNKKSAINMLLEYMKQLKEIAEETDYYKNDGMFISRDLDRALWVYGHACKQCPVLD